MSQGEPLSILLVEDDPAHAESIRRAFLSTGTRAGMQVVGTLRGYREQVAARHPNIAILDLKLPDGQAMDVLTSPPEAGLFPILVITSHGDERIAVSAMKAGALDYIVKSPEAFASMPQTVGRALREWKLLQERKRVNKRLHLAEFSIEHSSVATFWFERTARVVRVNDAACRSLGYSRLEMLVMTLGDFAPDFQESQKWDDVWNLIKARQYDFAIETRYRRRDGSIFPVEIVSSFFKYDGREYIFSFVRDISNRKRAEIERDAALEAVQASLCEKEILLREIHHRVKNNMQIISSLFNLQAGHTLNLECREILKEGQTRIHSMSLVHEKLYQSHDLSKIDLAGYIQNLAVHLFHVYLVDYNQVRLETDFEEVALDINSAVPCGLLLNELISNALQHGFPDGRKGVIRIGLKRGTTGTVELQVADNGVGFPEGSDFRKAESFGLQIVNLLVGQLEATIDLDRTNGTAFTVAFRELKYMPRI